MSILRLENLDVKEKRVLVRQDLNVPISDGVVTSSARIDASLGTMKYLISQGARTLVMSHLGRPEEGRPENRFSLAPVADFLSNALGQEVRLVQNYLETSPEVGEGEVVLLENVRFNKGEKADDSDLSLKYASLCDIYVMDAFGTAHRAQASTHGVGKLAPMSCAGPLLSAELDALDQAMGNPKRPMVAVVGGSKVSTKLTVLESMSSVVDHLVPGGGIANTFLAAAGFNVGSSLYEEELVQTAAELMELARSRGSEIPIPTDVVVGKSFSADTPAQTKPVSEVADDDMIFDIGPETVRRYADIMSSAGTILWNGPVGVFEFPGFAEGTRGMGEAIAGSSAFSIAGGGDTLAAIDLFNLTSRISYISTGGGAFLEFIEGKELPAVAMLKSRA